jgi:putative SOS response-associated peptidase YedK
MRSHPRDVFIPVSGYYEWQDTLSGNQPWYFTARDGSLILTAAGLWDVTIDVTIIVRDFSRSPAARSFSVVVIPASH